MPYFSLTPEGAYWALMLFGVIPGVTVAITAVIVAPSVIMHYLKSWKMRKTTADPTID